MADMADTADTAAIMQNMPNTANILARDRCEADTSSAAANRENTVTGAVVTGVAVIGAATRGIAGSPVTDSSSSVDLVIRITGVGTPPGAGAFLTRLTTAIILTGIILRIGTIMIPIAPYQESDSLGPDPSCIQAPDCSCVSITLPASSKTRITASCERLTNFA
jgi:hypothetical protein